jgi:hypothetical protein
MVYKKNYKCITIAPALVISVPNGILIMFASLLTSSSPFWIIMQFHSLGVLFEFLNQVMI